MATTTVGHILLKHFLPSQFHSLVEGTPLNKGGLSKLFEAVVAQAPEQYSKIASDLTRLGFEIATRQGTSITLKDLVSPVDRDKYWADFDKFKAEAEKSKDSQEVKDEKIFNKYNSMMSTIEKEVLDKGLAANKSLAKIILAGSRGTAAQYRGTISTQGLVVDNEGKPRFDVPIKSSYAEGLTLPEYLVTSFGARTGETLKKLNVSDGGFASKQFARALMPLQIVEADCDTHNGITVSTSDKETVGSFLCEGVGGYNRNNEVTAKMLNDLKAKGIEKILVRSPMTCQSNKNHHSGGLCQLCVGRREKGIVPLDVHVGLSAGTAVSEPLTESSMKSRHCLNATQEVSYIDPKLRKPIKDVKIGDIILGADKNRNTFPVTVLDVIDRGVQDVYRYTFKYGATHQTFTVEATENHVVLAHTYNCHNKSKNGISTQLPIGLKHNLYSLVLGKGFNDKGYKAEPFAFLLGLLLGDGSYSTTLKAVQYYNFDLTSIPYIQERLNPLNLKLHPSPTRPSQFRVTRLDTKQVDAFDGRNPALVKLEELGMYGKTTADKVIPDAVHTWDNTSVAELLSGLFFTDGSANLDHDKSKPGDGAFRSYSFTSSSRMLVEQVKYLLELRFGIYTSAITTRKKAGKPYEIEGRVGTCKYDGHMLRIRRPDAVAKFEKTIQLFGEKGSRFEKTATTLAPTEHDLYLCKRVKVEYLGKLPCYDLTVSGPDNLFVLANGAIVHNSGGAATSLGNRLSGFKLINQLANIPKNFIGRAPLSHEDGVVTHVEEAAAGGHFIHVNGHEHYVGLGQKPLVTVGQRVEQGQALSDGLVDPREAVATRGIGDGRKYYMETMNKAFAEGGLGVARRNFELIAKAAIDHVKITDPTGLGDYMPDQIVSYSALEKSYQPREDVKDLRPDLAYGKYLEKPVLHYTIGTRITSSVINTLKEHHIGSITVHDNPPNFEPTMIRLLDLPEHNEDWMHVLYSTNLAKRFVNMVNKGASSDVKGPSPIPGLAYGVGYGEKA